jgi:hypothetical protein
MITWTDKRLDEINYQNTSVEKNSHERTAWKAEEKFYGSLKADLHHLFQTEDIY